MRLVPLLALIVVTLVSCGGGVVVPPVNPLPPTIGWDIADLGGSRGVSIASIHHHVFVSLADGRLRALDVATGDPCWERSFGSLRWAASSDHIVVHRSDGTVEALDPFTGKTEWTARVPTGGENAPIVRDGLVLVAGDGICVLSEATGETAWCVDTPKGITSAAGLADGLVLAADGKGALHALDVRTGQQRWTFEAGGRVLTPPVADAHHRVFVATADGWILGLGTKNGKRRWRWHTGCDTAFPGMILDGHVWFAAQNGILYGLRCKNGNLDYRLVLPSRPVGPPLYDGQAFVVPCYSANANATSLMAFLAETGRRLGAAEVPGEMQAVPILVDRRMILAPRDGSLHAYDLAVPTPTPEDELAAAATGSATAETEPDPNATPTPEPPLLEP